VGEIRAHLQHGQRPPGITVGLLRDGVQRAVFGFEVQLAEAPPRVTQRTPQQLLEVGHAQRLQAEHARAAEQRGVHREAGVLGGGPDQRDRAVLHVRQERVLLPLVEAVDLVHEQDGALAVDARSLTRGAQDLAQVGHAS
jgi:hypothetical protein